MSASIDLIAIALAWTLYGALHSLLATTSVKDQVARRWPTFMPAYRLAYNVLATLLLLPPLWLTSVHGGAVIWDPPPWIGYPAAVTVALGYAWTLRWYDGMDFLGLRQWRTHRAGNAIIGEALTFSPLHRHVRHPWYALGLLFLWTRDLDAAWMVTVVVLTLYILLGIRLEERKLITLYGNAYVRYRARVPAIFPWPGHHLSPEEAEALTTLARGTITTSPPTGDS